VYKQCWAELTDYFSGLVLSLIDEILERFLHYVHKLLVLTEADGDYVVQFVFEI